MNCWSISPNSCDAKVFCWVPILVGVTFARYTICTMMYRIGVTKGKELQEIMGYYQFIPLVMIVREGFLYPSTPRQRYRPLRTPGHVQLLRGGTWIWTMGTTKHVPTWDFEVLISSCFGSLMQPSQFLKVPRKESNADACDVQWSIKVPYFERKWWNWQWVCMEHPT